MDDPPSRLIGILGGGQLGRMLAEAALRQGHRVRVLAEGAAVPAAIAGVDLRIGSCEDERSLSAFMRDCHVVTIENEFLDTALLGRVLDAQPEVAFRPGLAAIAVAQDKLAQKELCRRLDIASAPHLLVALDDAAAQRDALRRRFPAGYVLKWSRFGYDGRGNLAVGSDDPAGAEIERFCRSGAGAGASVYAEERIAFRAECAMVACRGVDGGMRFLPLTWTCQEAGVCREVVAPASAMDLPEHLDAQAQTICRRIAEHLDFVGCLAVEFFLTAADGLLVNEIAPRVHNTGHFSLFADAVSQFDWHIQAVTGGAPTARAMQGYELMRNLLAPADVRPETPCPTPDRAPPAGVELYWYDKDRLSPRRKMGHLSARAGDAAALATLRRELADWELALWRSLTSMGASDGDVASRTGGGPLHA